MPLRDMRSLAPTSAGILGCRPPDRSEVGPIHAIVRSIGSAPHLLLVVFDGFGIAALDRFRALCPNLGLVMDCNFRRLRAVPPPKTPVNFATMATGASRANHGIGQKTDPLGIETIFHTVAESGLTSCVAGRQSGSPAHLFADFASCAVIASSNTDEEVLRLALSSLRRERPSFTMVQFLEIDNAGHRSGPFGEECAGAVTDTDRRLGELMGALSELGGALIVLADHGQHEVEEIREGVPVRKGRHDGTRPEDYLVPLAWCTPFQLARACDVPSKMM